MIGVVVSVYLSYFDALVRSVPINLILKSFWVIGESKMGFLDDIGLENRRLNFCPDEHSLKRSTLRSSEQHFATPSLNFSRSLKRVTSEPQASKMLTFVICVA